MAAATEREVAAGLAEVAAEAEAVDRLPALELPAPAEPAALAETAEAAVAYMPRGTQERPEHPSRT